MAKITTIFFAMILTQECSREQFLLATSIDGSYEAVASRDLDFIVSQLPKPIPDSIARRWVRSLVARGINKSIRALMAALGWTMWKVRKLLDEARSLAKATPAKPDRPRKTAQPNAQKQPETPPSAQCPAQPETPAKTAKSSKFRWFRGVKTPAQKPANSAGFRTVPHTKTTVGKNVHHHVSGGGVLYLPTSTNLQADSCTERFIGGRQHWPWEEGAGAYGDDGAGLGVRPMDFTVETGIGV